MGDMSFGEIMSGDNAASWITLMESPYYPDYLVEADDLYSPVQTVFGKLVKTSASSSDLLEQINGITDSWMRVQLCRLFRRYVSPGTSVEMLKRKSKVRETIRDFKKGFRSVDEVQRALDSRKVPDQVINALLWEYKDRGIKGYNLTEKFFSLIEREYSDLEIEGPTRAGGDIILREVFSDYPNASRAIDFIVRAEGKILAVGLARYDGDRGGSQEDDRPSACLEFVKEFIGYSSVHGIKTKVVLLNDGPGLLLGSMLRDYSSIDEASDQVRVMTLRMVPQRMTIEWLVS